MQSLEPFRCGFSRYVKDIDLSSNQVQEDLKGVFNKSFSFLSSCALTKNSIDVNALERLRKFVFDSTTHELKFQTTSSSLSSKLWSFLGYIDEADGPQNLECMMHYIAIKLSKLAKIKFGPDKNSTLAKYLLENYTSIRMGISYLKAYYRNYICQASNTDNEEKSLERSIKTHHTITMSAAHMEGYTTDEIFQLTRSFAFYNKTANDLLEIEIYAPIKNIMSLGKTTYSKPFIKEVFKDGKDTIFMISCLKIDTELFPQVITPLYDNLEAACQNRFSHNNEHLQNFYMKVLNNEIFHELHLDVVIQLLKTEKWNETEKEFVVRCKSKPVMEALKFIQDNIQQIKNQTIPEENKLKLISNIIEKLENELIPFPPYKQIINFALVYRHQTAAENNPGLPFIAIGRPQLVSFLSQVILSFEDLNSIDLSDSCCRKKLLMCAEPIIKFKFSEALKPSNSTSPINDDKLQHWLSLFPEVTELECWPHVELYLKQKSINPVGKI